MNKTQKIYILSILLASMFSSCGNQTAEKSNDPDSIENKNIIEEESTVVSYPITGDCEVFINAIDFSSLCFTEGVSPILNIDFSSTDTFGRRCQYKFSNDEVSFVIIHKDYTKYSAEKIEMDQLITKSSFQKTGERLYGKTKKIDNLGDDAYIGYEGEDTKLKIVLSNVSISIEANKESCLSSESEIIKLGQLFINQIKK